MRKRGKTSNILSYLLIVFIFVTGCADTQNVVPVENQVLNDLIVEFIDVGQADSILIKTPNNKTILIDAGESGDYEKIKNTIDKYNIGKLDVVIATHPHSDHIGSMQKVIESYDIGRIYMPDKIHTSKTFENLLLTIENKGLEIDIAKAGVKTDLDDALDLKFVSPNGDFDDMNNSSAVLRLTYNDISLLFTGDMEKRAEELIVDNIDVDVLKVGHHGSDTSSTEEFLNKVTPEIAVISVGEENKYNHPSQDILDRLNNIGANIYRTDENGNITITTDGINLDIKTER